MKSALLSAFCASLTLAPIEVPDLRIWFAIMNFLFDSNNSANSIIATAKSKVFFYY